MLASMRMSPWFSCLAAAVAIPQVQLDEWTDLFDLLDRSGEGALSRIDFVRAPLMPAALIISSGEVAPCSVPGHADSKPLGPDRARRRGVMIPWGT